MIRTLTVEPAGPGLLEITRQVQEIVRQSGLAEGLATLFVQHTSASLLVQENDDPQVRRDLENWFARLIPEQDPLFTHTAEGPDDMPSHIRGALTAVSLSIPVLEGRLALGTWQGVFLWEHRRQRRARRILIHLGE